MEDFWYGMEMEWKKIVSMEYGKIVFHSIPYHALIASERSIKQLDFFDWLSNVNNLVLSNGSEHVRNVIQWH